MTVCPTCNSKLSCGCMMKTASNGARVCTLCIGRYEQQLKTNKQVTQPKSNAPTNPHLTYNPPK